MEQQASTQMHEVRWYHRKWFVVLMILLFWPVGLYLLWTSPETQRSGRIAWTVIVALIALVQLNTMFGGDEQQVGTTPVVAQPAQTPAPTREPEPAVSEEPTVQEPANHETAIEEPVATDDRPATESEPTWQVTHEWRGSGRKSTETFQVERREWRISWEATNEQVAGILQVFVFEENGTPVDVAVNHMGTGADTTYVRGRPGGRYYLEINAANIDWVVRVEELR